MTLVLWLLAAREAFEISQKIRRGLVVANPALRVIARALAEAPGRRLFVAISTTCAVLGAQLALLYQCFVAGNYFYNMFTASHEDAGAIADRFEADPVGALTPWSESSVLTLNWFSVAYVSVVAVVVGLSYRFRLTGRAVRWIAAGITFPVTQFALLNAFILVMYVLLKVFGRVDAQTDTYGRVSAIAVGIGILFFIGSAISLRASTWALSIWDDSGIALELRLRTQRVFGRRRNATAEDVLRGQAAARQAIQSAESAALAEQERGRQQTAEKAQQALERKIAALVDVVLRQYKARSFDVPGGELLHCERERRGLFGIRSVTIEIAGWRLFSGPDEVVDSDMRSNVRYIHVERIVWWLLSTKKLAITVERSPSVIEMSCNRQELHGTLVSSGRAEIIEVRDIDSDDKRGILLALQRLADTDVVM